MHCWPANKWPLFAWWSNSPRRLNLLYSSSQNVLLIVSYFMPFLHTLFKPQWWLSDEEKRIYLHSGSWKYTPFQSVSLLMEICTLFIGKQKHNYPMMLSLMWLDLQECMAILQVCLFLLLSEPLSVTLRQSILHIPYCHHPPPMKYK